MKKAFFIGLFTLLSVLSARAYDFEVVGIYYNVIEGTAQVAVTYDSREKYSGSVVIPATVTYDGTIYSVTAIGRDAFSYCWGLTSVTIPNSVTTIEGETFRECTGLTSVTIPESVTEIKDYAFYGCSGLTSVQWNAIDCQDFGYKSPFDGCENITSITFGKQVERIPAYLCCKCSGLTSVVIPESVDTIGRSAFAECSGLTSLTISEGVTSIEDWAFSGCSGLTSVTIPESVTSIGEGAFAFCTGLTSVTIPESVTSIGDRAFDVTAISSPLYNSKIFVYMPEDYSGEYTIPDGIQSIAGSAFESCDGLTSVTLPESVNFIGNRAFAYCYNLTSVTIPEGVTSIGDEAFFHSYSLASVMLPESVTFVGNSAFAGTAISSPLYNSKIFAYMPTYYRGEYAIPDGIQSIVGGAFYCSWLTSVVIPEGVTTIGYQVFYYCTGLTVTIPESVDSIGLEAFYNCSGISLYYGGDIAQWCGVKFGGWWIYWDDDSYDGWNLYINNEKVVDLVIPESVTSIRDYAFCACSVTSVTIPNSVTTIGHGALECFNLKSIYYGGDIAQWCGIKFSYYWTWFDVEEGEGWDLYINNEKIIDLEMPVSVDSIGDYTFLYCNLTSVTIGENVTSIGDEAFSGCSGLTSVTIPENVATIGDMAFGGCTGLTSVQWNATTCHFEYRGPFKGCENITSITFGNQVERIPAYLCYDCSGLMSVILPESLDTIDWGAFYGCDNLRDVYSLAKNPPVCSYDAFGIHENLYVPRGSKDVYAAAREWWRFTIYEFGFDGTGLVTVRVNDESMGTVVGGGAYDLDEQVKLEAIPNEGYHFVRWDDGNTDNPRILTVICDVEFTATFAKNEPDPSDPSEPTNPSAPDAPTDPTDPTSNEGALSAAPFAYVQGRTAYLSDGLGEVEVFTATGQRVYRGFDHTVTLPRPGVYILRVVADGRRCKVIVK